MTYLLNFNRLETFPLTFASAVLLYMKFEIVYSTNEGIHSTIIKEGREI